MAEKTSLCSRGRFSKSQDPLAEFMVAGDLKQGGPVTVDVEDNSVVLRRKRWGKTGGSDQKILVV